MAARKSLILSTFAASNRLDYAYGARGISDWAESRMRAFALLLFVMVLVGAFAHLQAVAAPTAEQRTEIAA